MILMPHWSKIETQNTKIDHVKHYLQYRHNSAKSTSKPAAINTNTYKSTKTTTSREARYVNFEHIFVAYMQFCGGLGVKFSAMR